MGNVKRDEKFSSGGGFPNCQATCLDHLVNLRFPITAHLSDTRCTCSPSPAPSPPFGLSSCFCTHPPLHLSLPPTSPSLLCLSSSYYPLALSSLPSHLISFTFIPSAISPVPPISLFLPLSQPLSLSPSPYFLSSLSYLSPPPIRLPFLPAPFSLSHAADTSVLSVK